MDNSTSEPIYQNEIDLKELFLSFSKQKSLIISVTALFFLGSIVLSLVLPKVWISSALLSPVEPSGKASTQKSSSGMGGLAAIAGLNLSPQSGQASLTLATLNSRDFFRHLLTLEGILPGLIAIKGFDESTGQNIYKDEIYNANSKKWIGNPPSEWNAYKAYRGTLTSVLQPKTGFIELAVQHRSPAFAKSFLDTVVKEVNMLSKNRDLIEAKRAHDYLTNILSKTSEKDMRDMLVGMIQSQVKIKMLADIKDSYVLEFIDSPYLPAERSSPQRTRMVLMSTIAGFIFSLLISIFRYYGTKYKFLTSVNNLN